MTDSTRDAAPAENLEIVHDGVVWQFEREFLTSNWRCLYGDGCRGMLDRPAPELAQGCCSDGAHFGQGEAGVDEAMQVAAHAALLGPEVWQYHDVVREAAGADGIFDDPERSSTRVVDGACVFLNRPGFAGGTGCALHLAARAAGESPIEWKPSVCWQLPLHVHWEDGVDATRRVTVRRWSRVDWGDRGATMAWCCTEGEDGGEAYDGEESVVDSMRAELVAIAGAEVYVELRRRL